MADRSVAPTLAVAGLAWVVIGLPSAVAITTTMFGLNLIFCGPLALRNYLSVAARRGILVKDGRSLELLTEVDAVVFDKTGTLTLDQPTVAAVHSFSDVSSLELLRYAAAVEHRQSHPIARAILAYAQERRIVLPEIDEARFEMGYGLRAEIENRLIHVGSDLYMALERIALPPSVEALQTACHEQGDALVIVARDGRLAGAIELKPTIRSEAKAVIDELRRHRLDFCIISGDQEGPTRVLAQALGISRYFANTLPEKKAGATAAGRALGLFCGRWHQRLHRAQKSERFSVVARCNHRGDGHGADPVDGYDVGATAYALPAGRGNGRQFENGEGFGYRTGLGNLGRRVLPPFGNTRRGADL